MTTSSLIESIDKRKTYGSLNDPLTTWQMGRNAGLAEAIEVVRHHPTPDSLVEKLEALRFNKVEGTASYRRHPFYLDAIDDALTIVRAHFARDNTQAVSGVDTDALAKIAGVLEPIADLDFHGKWRIQRAIAIATQAGKDGE